MKTFRELITWELDQEKKSHTSILITTEDDGGKLGSCVLRKLRHLSATATAHPKGTGTLFNPSA